MSTSRLDGTSCFAQLHRQVSCLDDDDRVQGAGDPFSDRAVLFKRPAGQGFLGRTFNLLFGRNDLRRHVDKALKEVQPLAADSKEVAHAIDAVKKEMRRAGNHGIGRKNHDLRAGAIRAHLNTIETAASVRRAPSLADVPGLLPDGGGGAIRKAAAHLRAAVDGTQALDEKQVVDELAGGLITALEKLKENARTKQGGDVPFSFSVSHGAKFKAELLQALRGCKVPVTDDSIVPELVDRAYEKALNVLDGTVGFAQPRPLLKPDGSPDLNADGTPKMDDGLTWSNDAVDGSGKPLGPVIKDVRGFMLDKTEFVRQEKYGDGGIGLAGRYKSADGRQLVLKFINPLGMRSRSDDEAFEEIATEACAHRAANKGAPGEFGKLERVLRMPDGRLAMVMELAPNGHTHGLLQKLAKSKAGNLETVRRTLVKDVLESVDALHRKAKMSHMDIKGANFFIDQTGKARLADFGLARKGNWRHMTDRLENMKWNDPHSDRLYRDMAEKAEKICKPFNARIEKEEAAIEAEIKRWTEAEQKKYPKDGTPANMQARRDVLKQADERKSQEKLARLGPIRAELDQALVEAGLPADGGYEIPGRGNDLWSVGTVIWEIYAGRPLFDDAGQGPGAVPAMQDAFLKLSPEARANHLFGPQSPVQNMPLDLQNMVMGLLDPDPALRPSAAKVLRHTFFKDNLHLGLQPSRQVIIDTASRRASNAAASASPPRP
jgi:serine/threonine protein kinase